jgi:hypothetical protein
MAIREREIYRKGSSKVRCGVAICNKTLIRKHSLSVGTQKEGKRQKARQDQR